MLACVAVLFWGLAGAAPAVHGATPKPVSEAAQGHAHNHARAAQATDAGDTANDQTNSQDRCSLSGCSFAAMTPAPLGAVVHALAAAPVLAPDTDAPESAAAPPLRPPRLS